MVVRLWARIAHLRVEAVSLGGWGAAWAVTATQRRREATTVVGREMEVRQVVCMVVGALMGAG